MKALFTLLASILFAAGSILTSDFGGFDPNRFPVPQVNPPLQPVGFAFSIWFVIYAWLIASAVYGISKRADDPQWQAFRIPLGLSLLIGAPWIQVAQVSPLWATIMIWAMLLLALVALWKGPAEDFAWARGPIGLYAGWLTAASAVGTSVLLSGYGILPQLVSAIAMLFVALFLAVWTILRHPLANLTYGLAVQWALVGIIIKSVSLSNPVMICLVSIGCLVVAWAIWRKRNS